MASVCLLLSIGLDQNDELKAFLSYLCTVKGGSKNTVSVHVLKLQLCKHLGQMQQRRLCAKGEGV